MTEHKFFKDISFLILNYLQFLPTVNGLIQVLKEIFMKFDQTAE